jgi:MFS family permease
VTHIEDETRRGASTTEPDEAVTDASTATPAPRGRTFAALSIPTYRLLWFGSVFSFLAVQMQMIARGALAFDLTGSNAALGTVMFGFGLPMLLLTPVAGVVADRISKRAIILFAQFLLFLSPALVGIALVTEVMQFWMLVFSAVAQAAAFAFLGPARMAFTSELVGRKLLGNAIVLQQMSMNGTRVFGPSLAGLLIAVSWFGFAGVYFLTAGFVFVASLLTFRLPPGTPPPEAQPKKPTAEFVDGLRYVKANPHLALLLSVSLIVIMCAFPYIAFLPTLSKEIFDAGNIGYGFMSGATAIGAITASLFIASRSDDPGVWKLQAAAGLAFGLGLMALAVTPTLAAALVVLVVVGGATSAFQALNNTMMLMGSETSYHGRMQSLMMLSFSGFGLMALPLGAIADAIGLRATFAGMGFVTAVAMVAYFFVRPAVERRHPTPVFD